MIDGLKEFIQMVGEFLSSLYHGLGSLVSSLTFVSGASSTASWWMPSAIYSVMILSLSLIIILRIIGR